MATKKAVEESSNVSVSIPAMNIKTITIHIVGDAPLIMHKWSEKAKKKMLDKQKGKATTVKHDLKNPEVDFKACIYHLDGGGYGFPAVAFKSAAVRAAKSAGLAMTDARAAFHVLGELVPIQGKPTMRKDMVRVANGQADIRFRAEFKEWQTTFTVRFNAGLLSHEQVVNLFNMAGFGTGVGEWRPEKNGQFGTFHVEVEV